LYGGSYEACEIKRERERKLLLGKMEKKKGGWSSGKEERKRKEGKWGDRAPRREMARTGKTGKKRVEGKERKERERENLTLGRYRFSVIESV
jgi:hypothetical protein